MRPVVLGTAVTPMCVGVMLCAMRPVVLGTVVTPMCVGVMLCAMRPVVLGTVVTPMSTSIVFAVRMCMRRVCMATECRLLCARRAVGMIGVGSTVAGALGWSLAGGAAHRACG